MIGNLTIVWKIYPSPAVQRRSEPMTGMDEDGRKRELLPLSSLVKCASHTNSLGGGGVLKTRADEARFLTFLKFDDRQAQKAWVARACP